MIELVKFEEKIWNLITEATGNKETEKLRQLTAVLDHIKRLKFKAEKIENAVAKLEEKIEKLGMSLPSVSAGATRSISWEIGPVDIADEHLSINKPMQAGLVPKDGSSFTVQTSLGQVFRTRLDDKDKTLHEQGAISKFFRGEGIRVGTKVTWTQIGPNKYSLEKAA